MVAWCLIDTVRFGRPHFLFFPYLTVEDHYSKAAMAGNDRFSFLTFQACMSHQDDTIVDGAFNQNLSQNLKL